MQTSIGQTRAKGDQLTVNILIHPCEEGGFTADCLEIPGCVSEGETEQEAEANIRNAIDACLSVIFEDSLARLRDGIGLAQVDMTGVSRREKLVIETPRLHDALCA